MLKQMKVRKLQQMLTNKYWEDRYRAEEKARELAEATANRLPDEILGSNADVHVSSAESALALAERMKSEHNFDF